MAVSRIAEYSRKRKNEGLRLFRCVDLCILYLFFGLFAAWSTLRYGNAYLLAGLLTLAVIVIWLTLPLFRETVDYEIVENEMRIYRVYGNSRSRLAWKGDLSAMTAIEPVTENTEKYFRAIGVAKVIDFLSRSDSPDALFALYEENGTKEALLFDGDEKFAQVVRYANPRANVRR